MLQCNIITMPPKCVSFNAPRRQFVAAHNLQQASARFPTGARVVDHSREFGDILHDISATRPLQQVTALKSFQLSGHRFTMRADPGRDLGMGRRRRYAPGPIDDAPGPRQTQQFRMDAVA